MKRYLPPLMLIALMLVALSLSFVIVGCSHSSNDIGVNASGLDCSDKALAESAHPMQLKMDCAVAKQARSREFQKTHDCTLSYAAKQPNPDEYYANCQGETWNGKHSDIWKQLQEKPQSQEMPKVQRDLLGGTNGQTPAPTPKK